MVRKGFDIDGVLADFNSGMRREIQRETGIVIPPDAMTHWNWPGDYLTDAELTRVWTRIHSSPDFWSLLDPYEGTWEVLKGLAKDRLTGDEIYFLSDRMGVNAKLQTELWLVRNGMICPTVILTGDKAGAAEWLKLDTYVDDKPENVEAVRAKGIEAELVIRPWNQERKAA